VGLEGFFVVCWFLFGWGFFVLGCFWGAGGVFGMVCGFGGLVFFFSFFKISPPNASVSIIITFRESFTD